VTPSEALSHLVHFAKARGEYSRVQEAQETLQHVIDDVERAKAMCRHESMRAERAERRAKNSLAALDMIELTARRAGSLYHANNPEIIPVEDWSEVVNSINNLMDRRPS
jgi:hypothetical protein